MESVENTGLGCALELFTEVAEVKDLIINIKTIKNDQLSIEQPFEKFRKILNQYQEQPHLLDPHLDTFLGLLIDIIRNPGIDNHVLHNASTYLYIIIKIRGYKVIVKNLPHEVSDMEPVLQLLSTQFPDCKDAWHTPYVLMLWLSIIVMIPFHMGRLDPSSTEGHKPVMDRILLICKRFLVANDKSRDAAAYLAAKFLTRPDIKEIHLPGFLDWAVKNVGPSEPLSSRLGVMSALALIFKHGKREDLLPFAPKILKEILSLDFKNSKDTLLRKLSLKLIQRIGLTFLRVRIAPWRYKRGNRSLLANLQSSAVVTDASMGGGYAPVSYTDDEEYDVPDEVEDIIEELLIGLRDGDTVIRWSAAKGVGRVTGRLPKDLADDVVGSALELFTLRESDNAWHGACLTLAELGRRGLLLPSRLDTVVPVILRALVYDEPRGSYSVGSHIRDAACYVCWAFARAYDPNELKPYVNQLASALLVVTVFDREVNCRRAASAAFQENVGRQGTFPHGIDILTTADYFAVGSRSGAFLSLSEYIGGFEEYTLSLIKHLVERKIRHWDAAVRQLSSKALHKLTFKNPTYVKDNVLPSLIQEATGIDLNVRHGCILAVAEVTHALALVAKSKGITAKDMLGETSMNGIRDIAKNLKEKQRLRTLGGELMRQAVAALILKCSEAHLPFHWDPVTELWQSVLEENLAFVEGDVQTSAKEALPAFMAEYFVQPGGGKLRDDKRDAFLTKSLTELKSSTHPSRIGFASALGSMPKIMYENQVERIIPALIQCATLTKADSTWAESRRESLKSLHSICSTVGLKSLPRQLFHAIINVYLDSLKDYTTDSRGDIGAWVREAAMTGLKVCITLAVSTDQSLLTPDHVGQAMCGLAQQAVERIDRTRGLAGRHFFSLLYHEPVIPGIPEITRVKQLFPLEECENMNWTCVSKTFPLFVELLSVIPYRKHVLLGLVVSVGGITESLVKSSSSSLFLYLKKVREKKALEELCDVILLILEEYFQVSRVTLSLFNMMQLLLNSGMLRLICEDPESKFPRRLLSQSYKEMNKCTEPAKLLAYIDVLCALLQVASNDVRNMCKTRLSLFLCHRYPRIRKVAADKMYEALMMYEDEEIDEAMTLLSEVNWMDDTVEKLRPIRNKLCEHLGCPAPKPIVRN